MRFHKAFQNKKSNSLLELNQSRWNNFEVVGLMMNQFYKKVRVKKVLVVLGVFFLLLQFQPGTKLLNLLTNHTTQSHSVTVE